MDASMFALHRDTSATVHFIIPRKAGARDEVPQVDSMAPATIGSVQIASRPTSQLARRPRECRLNLVRGAR